MSQILCNSFCVLLMSCIIKGVSVEPDCFSVNETEWCCVMCLEVTTTPNDTCTLLSVQTRVVAVRKVGTAETPSVGSSAQLLKTCVASVPVEVMREEGVKRLCTTVHRNASKKPSQSADSLPDRGKDEAYNSRFVTDGRESSVLQTKDSRSNENDWCKTSNVGGKNSCTGGTAALNETDLESREAQLIISCSICGKTTQGRNRKQNMENHMMTHYGLRPHKCNFCDYSSTQAGNLRRHIKKMHGQSDLCNELLSDVPLDLNSSAIDQQAEIASVELQNVDLFEDPFSRQLYSPREID